MSDKPGTIDELTKKYHALNERKIQSETQLKEAEKRLQELQTQALAEFGTSDVTDLQTRLEQMESENEKRRADYHTLLTGIQDDLEKIDSAAASEAE